MTYNLTQEEIEEIRTLVNMIDQATDYGERKLSFSDKQEEIVLDLIRDIQRFLS